MKKSRMAIAGLTVLLVLGVSPFAVAQDKPKKAEISILISANPPKVTFDESEYGKQILANQNVTLSIEYVAKDAQAREGLMVASGEFPDLVSPTSNSADNAGMGLFLKNKAFIPLDDLVAKYGTNIKKIYPGNALDKFKKNGKLYFLPTQPGWSNTKIIGGVGYWIQIAVLKDAGYPKITTVAEYFKLLENYMKKNPTINGKNTIAFEFQSDGWKFDSITNTAALAFGYQDDGGFLVDVNGKKATAKLYFGAENDKKNLKFLNEAFSRGLIDPECFVDKFDQFSAKITSGRVLGTKGWGYELNNINSSLSKQGMDERRFIYLPLVWEAGIQEKYANYAIPEQNAGIGITKSAKDPVRIMQFLDSLYSEDNIRLVQWGVKDVDYSVDKNGKYFYTPDQLTVSMDASYSQKKGLRNATNGITGIPSTFVYSDGNIISPILTKEVQTQAYLPIEKEALAAYGVVRRGDLFKWFNPIYGMGWSVNINADPEASKASIKKVDLVTRTVPRIIMDKPTSFDANWKEYTDKLSQINLKAIESYVSMMLTKRLEDGRTGE